MSKPPGEIALNLKINGINLPGLTLEDTKLDIETLEDKIAESDALEDLSKILAQAHMGANYQTGQGGVKKNINKSYHFYMLAAIAGHRPSQHNAASLIYDHIFTNAGDKPKLKVQKPIESFIRFLSMAAEGEDGIIKSKMLLAKCYLLGFFGIPKNEALALRYFGESTEKYPIAHHYVGLCHQDGLGTPVDLSKAFLAFKTAVEKNVRETINNLAVCYQKGQGVSKDRKRAAELYEQGMKICSKDDAILCQFNLAIMCLVDFGDNFPQNIPRGMKLLESLATNGNVEAQKYLGTLFLRGDLVPADHDKVFQFFLMAAEQGDRDAESNVGKCYLYGTGVKKNIKKAIPYLNKASEKGNVRAKVELAECYLQGNGVAKDPKKAVELLKEAAVKNDMQAERALGLCYFTGKGVKKKDPKKAYEHLKSAAEQGDLEARSHLGLFYLEGQVLEKDVKKASEIFESCIVGDRKSVFALNTLGKCLVDGTFGKQDPDRAFKLFKQAEKYKSGCSYFYLALCYRNAWGTSQDFTKMFHYLNLSIEQGYLDAELVLGGHYLNGLGVERNVKIALSHFKKGAAAQEGAAQNVMGMCYLKGWEGKPNPERAFKMFQLASERSIDALNNLGWCLLQGFGVKASPSEAVQYFEKAKQKGCLSAYHNLAWCFLTGLGVKKDVVKAEQLFNEAETHENPLKLSNQMGFSYLTYYSGDTVSEILEHNGENAEMIFLVGKCLSQGVGLEPNQKLAFELYSKASQLNHKSSELEVAHAYLNGKGIQKNQTIGFNILKNLMAKYKEAIEIFLRIAQCHLQGWGTTQDIETAISMIQFAVQFENGFANTLLGWCYEKGFDSIELDLNTAFKYYNKAAGLGDAVGQLYLGWFYEHGMGVPQNESDLKKAFENYVAASKQGNNDALNNVASFYEEGLNVEKDCNKAFHLYLRAAKSGHAMAQYNIVRCYEHGIGTAINHVEAQKWLQKYREHDLEHDQNQDHPHDSVQGLEQELSQAFDGALSLERIENENRIEQEIAHENENERPNLLFSYSKAKPQGNSQESVLNCLVSVPAPVATAVTKPKISSTQNTVAYTTVAQLVSSKL